jgi:folate-binding protein YgfZ
MIDIGVDALIDFTDAPCKTPAHMADSHPAAPATISLPDRGVLRVAGPDRLAFLQGLVSNDVAAAAPGQGAYACLLTPQGKFLHDFFIVADADSLLIECEAPRLDDLHRRLKTYRLRSKVEFADESSAFAVFAAWGATPPPPGAIAFPDPRTQALGIRFLAPAAFAPAASPSMAFAAYDRLRIAEAVPDGGRDMEVGKAILLENNIDFLNGVAWNKGCYIGQELTARTHYRGLVKKRLVPVRITGAAPDIGTPLIENGVEIGEMRSSQGDLGLALLKLEIVRQRRPIAVDGATLWPEPPAWLAASIAEPPKT